MEDIDEEDFTYAPLAGVSELEQLRQELMAYRVLLTGAAVKAHVGQVPPANGAQYADYFQELMYAGIYGGGFYEQGVSAKIVNRVCKQLHIPPVYKAEKGGANRG